MSFVDGVGLSLLTEYKCVMTGSLLFEAPLKNCALCATLIWPQLLLQSPIQNDPNPLLLNSWCITVARVW